MVWNLKKNALQKMLHHACLFLQFWLFLVSVNLTRIGQPIPISNDAFRQVEQFGAIFGYVRLSCLELWTHDKWKWSWMTLQNVIGKMSLAKLYRSQKKWTKMLRYRKKGFRAFFRAVMQFSVFPSHCNCHTLTLYKVIKYCDIDLIFLAYTLM